METIEESADDKWEMAYALGKEDTMKAVCKWLIDHDMDYYTGIKSGRVFILDVLYDMLNDLVEEPRRKEMNEEE